MTQKQSVIELIKAHLQEELAELRSGQLIENHPNPEIQAIERALLMYRFLPVRAFTREDVVEPVSLIELEFSGRSFWVLLVPQHGGLVTQHEGKPVQVLTPQSPIGEAMSGKKVGDTFTVQTGSGARQYRILNIV